MKQEKKKKETIISLFGLVVLTLAIVGVSYAAFNYIREGQKENTINTGNLTFVYDESKKSGNGISIENATPTSDELGKSSVKQGEVFEFNISASTKGAPIYYEIYVTKQSDSTLPERIVKTYLTELQGTEEVEVLDTLNNKGINFYNELGISKVPNQENGRTLYQEMIPEGQDNYSKTFRYRMWIREDATETNERGVWKYANKSFTVKVSVYASNEEIPKPSSSVQEPNEPVLVQGQIPVVYNETEKTWVKADTGTNWYDYDNQEWANVVTVKETGTKTRSEYMNASVGTPVSMDDINTMWVWIPRYEYMYTNLGENYAGGTQEQPGEIKVNFLSGKSTTPSDSSNYKVHPAFTFGEDELEGLWYAKFETTGALSSACTNVGCNASGVTIKPGVYALRNQLPSSFFYMARSMQMNNSSTFGFEVVDSDLHMSKNSEWGSVAYLSQSKYGKYGNSNYEGANKEVAINSSGFITGGGTEASYIINMAQSTTGNTTGVYDMNGGTAECVMGVLADSNGNPMSGGLTSANSGFNGRLEDGSMYTSGVPFPEAKYYDLYIGKVFTTACSNGVCFGHALSETAGWYDDKGPVPRPGIDSWFLRGGGYNRPTISGVFTAEIGDGDGRFYRASRLVHVPLK